MPAMPTPCPTPPLCYEPFPPLPPACSWQVDAETVKSVANRFILDQDVAIASMGDTQVGASVVQAAGIDASQGCLFAGLLLCGCITHLTPHTNNKNSGNKS